jgi:hypothetical protein
MNGSIQTQVWYIEVHARAGKTGPLYWQRQLDLGEHATLLDAQLAAAEAGRRPYRIKYEFKEARESA